MINSDNGDGDIIDDEQSYSCALLEIIDNIEPNKLKTISHSKYVRRIAESICRNLQNHGSNILLIIKSIKRCKQPCYKRNVLIEVLDILFKSDDALLTYVLCDNGQGYDEKYPWKELANSIVTIPDLIANCNELKRYSNFEQAEFHSLLLTRLYSSLSSLSNNETKIPLSIEQRCFCAQLLGRIALSSPGKLIWEKFTHQLSNEVNSDTRTLIVDIFTFPLQTSECQSSDQFELFIEPLYMPIFNYLKPCDNSGQLIESLIGNYILRHESFEYILCDKALLQTNYDLKKHSQTNFLLNVFAYLSRISVNEAGGTSTNDSKNILMATIKKVVKSWKNGTKVLFRSYEHNRFISCVLIIAFKYAFKYKSGNLVDHIMEIQSMIMQGLSIYLNRSSSELRDLAMCVGQLILPKLHETQDKHLARHDTADTQKMKEDLKMEFDIKLSGDCIELERIFKQDFGNLFDDVRSDESSPENKSLGSKNVPIKQLDNASQLSIKPGDIATNLRRRNVDATYSTTTQPSRAAVVELSDDEDDLVPYEMEGYDDKYDSDEEVGGDFENVPIYLRDCINGLSEQDTSVKYYRLCLIKAGELIDQLLEQDESRNSKQLTTRVNRNNDACSRFRNESLPTTNDAIRDVAVELAQLLLYLENQYNIDNFNTYRMKTMTSLCVAAPDLVVKYYLDEFNGSNKNTRHQLDILQALVASAQQLSGAEVGDFINDKDCSTSIEDRHSSNNPSGPTKSSALRHSKARKTADNFVRYVSLYFYGITHKLKAEYDAHSRVSPLSILSAVKETSSGDNLDDSYLLSRILFSISLIIRCVDQQPIMRKLSTDLLDTLAAYRCHPDTGVRKAIVACLSAIKSCTPSVYFDEYLYDKTLCLFGGWIKAETELIRPLMLRLRQTTS